MRILILSASAGAGHVRAAEAVEAALRRSDASVSIENLDVLSLMAPAFRKVYCDGYFEMVRRAPRLLGWLYEATDKPFHPDLLRQKLEQAGAARLIRKIRAFDPDVAICTHFLPAALLDRERRHGRSRARIITVVTDIEVHGMWLAVPSAPYFSATAEAKAHLESLGIAPGTVTDSGIPTHPVFADPADRAKLRAKHGWRRDLPALLLSAGGFGAGHAERMVESLLDAGLPAQIIAVCGKNAALRSSITKLAARRKAQQFPVLQATGLTTD